MASLGQYCTRNCLISSKNTFNTSSISQSCNARQFSNIAATHHSTRPTFCQLSLPGGKKQLMCVSFPKSKEDQWRVRCGDDGSCGIAPFSPHIPSAVDLIKQFYSAINSKDPQILDEKFDQLLSDGCEYQDLFFYIPFQGKQGIKKFMCDVMEAMGQHIQIVIDDMKEGENYSAIVFWHLGWNDILIPFTTGCMFFECEELKGKLLIRKITGVEEFPLKPGELLLKLLKAVSDMCDRYPTIAEGLLKLKPHGSQEGGLESLLEMFGLKKD
ncbi:uncharacterized protein LOC132185930 [Corylus avellana]|uniref:uncharacterized protein LOC132185930 n=1 Tax=Corylus avellana TaxID=13451 RepID=UPI00286B99D7|nr:uncharacterized protein LOC132185930 [Corylus avellana]